MTERFPTPDRNTTPGRSRSVWPRYLRHDRISGQAERAPRARHQPHTAGPAPSQWHEEDGLDREAFQGLV